MAYSLEGQFSSSTTRDFQGVLDAVKKKYGKPWNEHLRIFKNSFLLKHNVFLVFIFGMKYRNWR